jgi:hypothetical protein
MLATMAVGLPTIAFIDWDMSAFRHDRGSDLFAQIARRRLSMKR